MAKIFGGKDVQLLFTSSLRGPPAINLATAETPDRYGGMEHANLISFPGHRINVSPTDWERG